MPRKTSSRHALGMRLGVSERERRAPGAAEHLPALDAEMLAQPLHVVDEMPGGVLLEAACGVERPQPRWSNSTMR